MLGTILLIAYCLVHGMFICWGVLSFGREGGFARLSQGYQEKKPFYLKLHPLLSLLAFLLGPIGVFTFFVINFFVPDSQKMWYQ